MHWKPSKTLIFFLFAPAAGLITLGQWLMWGKNVFNLHTLCVFIGFAVGYAIAYSAVIWPPKRNIPTRYRHAHHGCKTVWIDDKESSLCQRCHEYIKGTKI